MGKGRRVLKGDAALGARAASFFQSFLLERHVHYIRDA